MRPDLTVRNARPLNGGTCSCCLGEQETKGHCVIRAQKAECSEGSIEMPQRPAQVWEGVGSSPLPDIGIFSVGRIIPSHEIARYVLGTSLYVCALITGPLASRAPPADAKHRRVALPVLYSPITCDTSPCWAANARRAACGVAPHAAQHEGVSTQDVGGNRMCSQ